MCKRQADNISHALFTCKMARKIWNLVPFAGKILEVIEQPMRCALQDMAVSLKRTEMKLLIAICWAVWHARNLFILKGKQVDPLTTLAKAEAIIDYYRRFKNPSPNHLMIKEETSQPLWCPPPVGLVKINVDAVTNLEKQAAGLGVVVRDCR